MAAPTPPTRRVWKPPTTSMACASMLLASLSTPYPFPSPRFKPARASPRSPGTAANWLVMFESYSISGNGGYYQKSLAFVRVSPSGQVLDPKPVPIFNAVPITGQWAVANNGDTWVVAFWGTGASGDLTAIRISPDGLVLDPPTRSLVPATYYMRFNLQLACAAGTCLATFNESPATGAVRFDSNLNVLGGGLFTLLPVPAASLVSNGSRVLHRLGATATQLHHGRHGIARQHRRPKAGRQRRQHLRRLQSPSQHDHRPGLGRQPVEGHLGLQQRGAACSHQRGRPGVGSGRHCRGWPIHRCNRSHVHRRRAACLDDLHQQQQRRDHRHHFGGQRGRAKPNRIDRRADATALRHRGRQQRIHGRLSKQHRRPDAHPGPAAGRGRQSADRGAGRAANRARLERAGLAGRGLERLALPGDVGNCQRHSGPALAGRRHKSRRRALRRDGAGLWPAGHRRRRRYIPCGRPQVRWPAPVYLRRRRPCTRQRWRGARSVAGVVRRRLRQPAACGGRIGRALAGRLAQQLEPRRQQRRYRRHLHEHKRDP